MASLTFWCDNGASAVANLSGSGLGFFGGSFGQSVELGAWQAATFITNSTGTTQGTAIKNVQYQNAMSGIVNGAPGGTGLWYIPNKEATLNIRFTDSTTRLVQNAEMRIFDRVNIDFPASGVRVRIAELIHPSDLLTVPGSGDRKWWGDPTHTGDFPAIFTSYVGTPNQSPRLAKNLYDEYTVGGSGIVVPFANSPGVSGFYAQDGDNGISSAQHDWYAAISASPTSIGSKTQFALYFSTEYA